MEAAGVTDVATVLVAADTVPDVTAAGERAPAWWSRSATGHVPEDTLAAAGPTHVLAGVADLPELLADRTPLPTTAGGR